MLTGILSSPPLKTQHWRRSVMIPPVNFDPYRLRKISPMPAVFSFLLFFRMQAQVRRTCPAELRRSTTTAVAESGGKNSSFPFTDGSTSSDLLPPDLFPFSVGCFLRDSLRRNDCPDSFEPFSFQFLFLGPHPTETAVVVIRRPLILWYFPSSCPRVSTLLQPCFFTSFLMPAICVRQGPPPG